MDTAQLRDLIARYLLGDVSLLDFQERVVQEAIEAFSGVDFLSSAMLADVELRLAEYTNGDSDEAELMENLKSILYGMSSATFVRALVEMGTGSSIMIRTASTSRPQQSPFVMAWPSAGSADTELLKESA